MFERLLIYILFQLDRSSNPPNTSVYAPRRLPGLIDFFLRAIQIIQIPVFYIQL